MTISSLLSTIVVYMAFSLAGLFSKPQTGFSMEFVDVGQGDSIYITTKHGKKILIDGGDNYTIDYELAKKMPFYSCNLDVVILTHPHYDHLNGLNRILNRCKISTLMFNDVDFSSKGFSDFKETSKKINAKNLFKGDEFEIDDVSFKVLWPSKEFTQQKGADINDTSIVLFVDYGDFEAFLLGDVNDSTLSNLDLSSIKPLIAGDLEAIKVSHHGSKYGLDEQFYLDLKPRNCIIEVGKDNKFGHPNKEVLEFLESIKCNILRTDLMGNIVLKVL
ncbi:MBL fold metallo-hydrolase [Patescibacteria group bacterium]|nr:MBL fold metallo-hydrolase [Patescibacteria group bacterium]MBU1952749.1 MBL fold metallo-hydrolase [Patescibacteria group bacterium]